MARSDAGRSEENTWGFGQMFPVILLVLPILSALETYYGKPGQEKSFIEPSINRITSYSYRHMTLSPMHKNSKSCGC